MTHNTFVLGRIVPRDTFTLTEPLTFTTEISGLWGNHFIPAGTEVTFFETRDFGYVIFTDADGQRRVARY